MYRFYFNLFKFLNKSEKKACWSEKENKYNLVYIERFSYSAYDWIRMFYLNWLIFPLGLKKKHSKFMNKENRIATIKH